MPQAKVINTTNEIEHATVGGRHRIDSLSFVCTKRRGGRNFWNVKNTGDYGRDCATGDKYALQYLTYQAANPERASILPHIVGDMPRNLGGLEVGFLTNVCAAAVEGRMEGERLAAFWRQLRSQQRRQA